MCNNQSGFERHKEELMMNSEFREEYEKLQPEFDVMKALVTARCDQGLTQKELSKQTGIRQSNISRIEQGKCSPTMDTLKKLAEGLGMRIQIQFVKKNR